MRCVLMKPWLPAPQVESFVHFDCVQKCYCRWDAKCRYQMARKGDPKIRRCGRRKKKARDQIPSTINWQLLSHGMGSCRRLFEPTQQPSPRHRGQAAEIWGQATQANNQGESLPLEHQNEFCQSFFVRVRLAALTKKSFMFHLVSMLGLEVSIKFILNYIIALVIVIKSIFKIIPIRYFLKINLITITGNAVLANNVLFLRGVCMALAHSPRSLHSSLARSCFGRYIEYHGIKKLYAEYKKDVHAKNQGAKLLAKCMVCLFFIIYF